MCVQSVVLFEEHLKTLKEGVFYPLRQKCIQNIKDGDDC